MLDFDPQVLAFSSQLFWLCWPGGRRSRRHAPSFSARLADGTGVVVDVRLDDLIDPRSAESLAVTAGACEQAGCSAGSAGRAVGLGPVVSGHAVCTNSGPAQRHGPAHITEQHGRRPSQHNQESSRQQPFENSEAAKDGNLQITTASMDRPGAGM